MSRATALILMELVDKVMPLNETSVSQKPVDSKPQNDRKDCDKD
ncbi:MULTISPECIES: hypothetical protein [Leptolyngbya]|nr:hypothetical protein [Leptolyngbya sp. FACHB-1624]